jgi:hypothetical protein
MVGQERQKRKEYGKATRNGQDKVGERRARHCIDGKGQERKGHDRAYRKKEARLERTAGEKGQKML